VTTKAVKRMELYKPRGSAAKASKKLLLPVSFGTSSTCLLSILNTHLEGQLNRMGRTSYDLLIAHVDLGINRLQGSHTLDQLEKLKGRFPNYTYISTCLQEALDLDIDWEALGLENFKVERFDSDEERLRVLFSSVSSATSRADIVSTLLTRLLVHIAKKNHCESILFGDSTTRLAEKTLTETAKGRGFSLPWQVSDGVSPYGIAFQYPLRDLLKKELVMFSSLTSSPLDDLIVCPCPSIAVSPSAKSTTIDDLMAQYFESVEENYPSIVANVVRTSSKLKAPVIAGISVTCGLCKLPVAKDTGGIYGWGGDQSSYARSTEIESDRGILCYGCARSITS
jgi:cytoplasmic tRNA 2-thiolation protein 2